VIDLWEKRDEGKKTFYARREGGLTSNQFQSGSSRGAKRRAPQSQLLLWGEKRVVIEKRKKKISEAKMN